MFKKILAETAGAPQTARVQNGPQWQERPPRDEGAAPKRDPKKLALLVGLSALAWMSTYTGMLELIQANLGDVGLIERIGVGMAVAMLQIMIVWLLDQLFTPMPALVKGFYAFGYLFLTLISVGFAFGFYWKVLESRSESTRSAESSVGQVHGALSIAQTNLEQLSATLVTLTTISSQKAQQEAANGNSCPGSRPGAGPRMALRKGDAERFEFASNFVNGRVTQVKSDVAAIETDLTKIIKGDASIVDAKTGTRNDFLKAMGRRLDETVTRLNAFRADPQLRQMRIDFAERAEKSTFADSKGGQFQCADPQLQTALRGVVRAIDGLPNIERPKIAATEGSEAVIEAFRRLTTTLFGALQFRLPPSPEELRTQQQKAVASVENAAIAQKISMDQAGLGKRDYIPLGIAIFVDFCLLMVSFGRPTRAFDQMQSKTKEAQQGPVFEILSRFHDIHNDAIQKNFEIFRHVIFDHGGKYYIAVPLAAPPNVTGEKQRRALELEAQSLANLFSGLEGQGLISRNGNVFAEWAVARKLRRQQSKFAQAGAFRVYRFKNGAWPEMILGAIMGAAELHKVELERKRQEEANIEKEERRRLLDAKSKLSDKRLELEAELEMQELKLKYEARREALIAKAAQAAALSATAARGINDGQRERGQRETGLSGRMMRGLFSSGHAEPAAPKLAEQEFQPRRASLSASFEAPRPAGRPANHNTGPVGPERNPMFAPESAARDRDMEAQPTRSQGMSTHQDGSARDACTPQTRRDPPPPGYNTAGYNAPTYNAPSYNAPGNVIPLMPDRHANDRVLEADARGEGQTLPAQGQPSPSSDHSDAFADVTTTPVPKPFVVAPEPPAEGTNIGALLKGVAVTQIKAAHDIAAAVQQMEHSAQPAGARTIVGARVEDGLVAREMSGWKAVGTEFEREVVKALEPRRENLARPEREAPRLSDLGDGPDHETTNVASRFAPVQRTN